MNRAQELNYLKRKASLKEKTQAKKLLRREAGAAAALARGDGGGGGGGAASAGTQQATLPSGSAPAAATHAAPGPAVPRVKPADERMEYMRSQLGCGLRVCVDLAFVDGQSAAARNSVYKQVGSPPTQ
jgi:hypothetical protein